MTERRVLTFDLGATSGRAMVSAFDGSKITSKEIHRFLNEPVMIRGRMYWDVIRIFHEMKTALVKACREAEISAIGIDTWGVDFALIDKNGNMISNPVHYRDARTEGMPEKVFSKVPKEEIYAETGIQFMRINTLYQLAYLAQYDSAALENAETLLLIPDLFAYFLTGAKRAEFTAASTTNLLCGNKPEWSSKLCEKVGLPFEILPKIIMPGELYGYLTDDICTELSVPKIPVYASAAHDTASAVAGVPARSGSFAYLSSGTWSLMGTELDRPIITPESESHNFTNEKGVEGTTRFLKNIMGFWIVEEARRQWKKEGLDVSFPVILAEAEASEPFKCVIDVDCPDFELPGNMPERIRAYCKRTNQYVPQTRGEILRCVFEGLALKYRNVLKSMEKLVGKRFDSLNIVGGGIKNEAVCSYTASACGITVYAGPAEAAVAGNAAVLFIALGDIENIARAREIIYNSSEIKVYKPINSEMWNKMN